MGLGTEYSLRESLRVLLARLLGYWLDLLARLALLVRLVILARLLAMLLAIG